MSHSRKKTVSNESQMITSVRVASKMMMQKLSDMNCPLKRNSFVSQMDNFRQFFEIVFGPLTLVI